MKRIIAALALAVVGVIGVVSTTGAAAQRRPDLVVVPADYPNTYGTAWSQIVLDEVYTSADCDVREGLVTPGPHKMLRFNTVTANIGAANLMIGNPASRDWFVYAPCHDHYHFETYANYRLLDANDVEVGLGHKQGFCLEDSYLAFPALTKRTTPKYLDCDTGQGISVGWADDYGAALSGQYIVVDGLPPGVYTLEVTVNYAHVIPESDYSNNQLRVPVTIP